MIKHPTKPVNIQITGIRASITSLDKGFMLIPLDSGFDIDDLETGVNPFHILFDLANGIQVEEEAYNSLGACNHYSVRVHVEKYSRTRKKVCKTLFAIACLTPANYTWYNLAPNVAFPPHLFYATSGIASKSCSCAAIHAFSSASSSYTALYSSQLMSSKVSISCALFGLVTVKIV